MLMKYQVPATRGQSLLHTADAALGFLRLHAERLCRAIQHRRDITGLVDQDDRLLADMGVTRNDVHHAIRQPLWHDPTEALRRHADAARSRNLKSTFMGWRSAGDQNCRALAELDDSELSSLSDLGRRVRHDAQQRG
jgi:uncharacterized protein YjiS (DUF1127 family)